MFVSWWSEASSWFNSSGKQKQKAKGKKISDRSGKQRKDDILTEAEKQRGEDIMTEAKGKGKIISDRSGKQREENILIEKQSKLKRIFNRSRK